MPCHRSKHPPVVIPSYQVVSRKPWKVRLVHLAPQVPQVPPESAFKENKVSLGKALLGLLVWLVTLVALGVLVGKVLKVRGEPLEPPEWVNRVNVDRKANQEWVSQGNGAKPVRQAHLENP
jgi:hypothetical protein